jgi:two-component system OmpR family response regulator
MTRVLVVEDNADLAFAVTTALESEGFDVAVAGTGPDGVARARARDADLIILDLMLPGFDGFRVIRTLRQDGIITPILVLTARGEEADKVRGLRLGADDYVTKDVSLPHLLARIAALFRRVDAAAQAPAAGDILHRGKLDLDAQRMTASWAGKPVALTVTEFWMVHSLARHPGHVKDRDQLMRDAEMVVDDGTITSHVKRIRKKFLAADPAFAAIETVYGMGYRWMEGA